MKNTTLPALLLTSATLYAAGGAGAPTPAQQQATQTQAIVAVTTTFLHSLSAAQRAQVQFAFTPQKTATVAQFKGGMNGTSTFLGEQYGQSRWSNYPVSDVPRPGLTLGHLNAAQRQAAMNVLKVILSTEGYQKVVDIMDADQVLSASGTPYDDGKAFYTLGVFGTPSATAPWMLQVGGHHLGLNVVVVGTNVSLTPTLTGDQPASFVRNGQTVRPLGDENDKAFRLMNALSTAQQKKATLTYQINDLVLGPGQDGKTLQPEGLPASEMTPAQQALLFDLIGEWARMLNPTDAAPKLAQIKANLNRTYFAWHGNTTNPSPVYYRITGPTLHIEFAHQQADRPGTGAQKNGINHIHTVYRDPTNEYGTAWTMPK
ncbi:DUF3500 domain-containing protein [Deinococcus ruber]|uniref:DUF3500 domain-containing protein n=1 Tax=Deinococcus ruber TaxID=1848197 RepID=A0A918KW47_9DEIO|nr:DUF3500 domain-containing protein [Deinococcus ruber]GGR36537.1 hypothetical protein GCM10008957_52770 [Deinococcus ruber]